MSDELVLSAESPPGSVIDLPPGSLVFDQLVLAADNPVGTVTDIDPGVTTALLEAVQTGPAGSPGAQGPPGPPGAPGGGVGAAPTVFVQSTSSDLWQFTHSYPYRPIVETFNNDGEEILGDESHPNPTTVRVKHGFPMTGTLVLR